MRLVVKRQCIAKIVDFYHHVARKYKHTYSKELMHKNIDDAFNAIYRIEHTIPRRRPTLTQWQGMHMAKAGKWYYAYTVDGDTITICDACHEQNMAETT
jgi:hypothetical protein